MGRSVATMATTNGDSYQRIATGYQQHYSRPCYASTKPFDYRAKGDALWLRGSIDFGRETTRSAQEQIVWGLWGEPRMSNSQRLAREQDAEIERYRDEHGSLARKFFHRGQEVGGTTSMAHAPPKMAPGARVGECTEGRQCQIDIRTAAGDLHECMEYITQGFDVNARDTSHDGWSMLHYAAQWDRVKIIELLLNHGADPQQRDWTGKTPIKLAKELGQY